MRMTEIGNQHLISWSGQINDTRLRLDTWHESQPAPVQLLHSAIAFDGHSTVYSCCTTDDYQVPKTLPLAYMSYYIIFTLILGHQTGIQYRRNSVEIHSTVAPILRRSFGNAASIEIRQAKQYAVGHHG